jgi:hypothetical protein
VRLERRTGLIKQETKIFVGGDPLPNELILIETDAFEHREVKPHFINSCCFGEDLAEWLRQKLARLGDGLKISEPVQEDYGWGLWLRTERTSFWVAISYVGNGPTEEPAQWVISVAPDYGLSILKRLFAKPRTGELAQIRKQIQGVIQLNPEIKILR